MFKTGSSARLPFRYGLAFAGVIMIGVLLLCGAFLVRFAQGSDDSDDSVRGFLRGGVFLIVRLPSTTGVDGVTGVYEDGRFFTPVSTQPSEEQNKLSIDSLQIINDVRNQWCRQAPVFRDVKAGEPYYVVGVRCSPFRSYEAHVPIDQLPQPLDQLVARLT
jgi:hypothetical protein